MGIGVTIVVSLLLAAATVVIHYELLQFAGTLPRRLTVPTRPRIIIVIGVVLAAHKCSTRFAALLSSAGVSTGVEARSSLATS